MATSSTVPIAAPTRIAPLTAGQVILAALQDLGVMAARETVVNDADAALGLRVLNTMLDEWTADGANQWRIDDADFPWPAQTFEVTPDIDGLVDIEDVQVFDTPGFSRPLARWEKADMDRLPNQATCGYPTCYSVRNGLNGPVLRLWPAPLKDTLLHLTYARANASVTTLSNTLDVPVRWQSTVIANLADRLSTAFQVEAPAITTRANLLYQRLRADDRPASYSINAWSA